MILVTGAKGMIGGYVTDVFPPNQVVDLGKEDLDVTDWDACKQVFDEIHPSLVIHLAAKTDVDECERLQVQEPLPQGEGIVPKH